jgi:hypothetical protein
MNRPPTPLAIEAKKLFVMQQDGLWYAFVVGLDDDFLLYRSNKNFSDSEWVLDTNKFQIDDTVDVAQIAAYSKFGVLYAYASKYNTATCYKSTDQGKTWTKVN